ncbi:MAG: hypothetical protein IT282_15540 [Bacteroidetes bacterium]|nr:hypothetical protein [Bacteroidota bacterium]
MRIWNAVTFGLGLTLMGCTAAYNTRTVGPGPHDIAEPLVMADIVGENVVLGYEDGRTSTGFVRSTSADSIRLMTSSGERSVPRAGLMSIKDYGTIWGNIIGLTVGASVVGFAGGLIGGAIGWTGTWGWHSLNGAAWGFLIGAVAGGAWGLSIGRDASAGTIYVWPTASPATGQIQDTTASARGNVYR